MLRVLVVPLVIVAIVLALGVIAALFLAIGTVLSHIFAVSVGEATIVVTLGGFGTTWLLKSLAESAQESPEAEESRIVDFLADLPLPPPRRGKRRRP